MTLPAPHRFALLLPPPDPAIRPPPPDDLGEHLRQCLVTRSRGRRLRTLLGRLGEVASTHRVTTALVVLSLVSLILPAG